MSRSLVIVESPAKARTIKKYLGEDFDVVASVGHIKNLPDHSLGVDMSDGFHPEYEIIRSKRDIVRKIKSSSKVVDDIYLAPDPDREGEAIAWHIAEEIGDRAGIHRVLINEITRKAVIKAIESAVELDRDRYNAQQTRRILDRLVGYQISPLLWKKVRQGLSAGRVQSVALRILVERELAIRAFVPREFWRIPVKVEGQTPPPFMLRYHGVGGKKHEIGNGEDAHRATDEIRGAELRVAKVQRKQVRRKSPAPFITSRLQQEASRKLRFTPKKTMRVAQSLYEGIELDGDAQGLITYMRTDSTRLSGESIDAARSYIDRRWGGDYLPEKPNFYAAKKGAQDAHEAIRPTDVTIDPKRVAPYLDGDQLKLYRLIWNRFIACQMTPALYDQVNIDVTAGDHLLKAKGSVQVFDGFSVLYTEGKDNGEADDDKEIRLPQVHEGETLRLLEVTPSQHFTEPPSRYTESTLIRDLEEKGIGRPSTYALILSNIQDREYVRKHKGKFQPSELGITVSSLLGESFPDIISEEFTAEMEKTLDDIEEGGENWQQILARFYQRFQSQLEVAQESMRNIKREGLPTEHKCDKCESPMVLKWGRNGQFLACSAFPECRNTKNVEETEDGAIKPIDREIATEEICEKCGSAMVIKHGRYGKFLACIGFPKCKNTRPLDGKGRKQTAAAGKNAAVEEPLPEGEELPECPKCGAPTVRRRGRWGTFVACSRYPQCKTIVRGKGRKKTEEASDAGES